MVGEKKRCYQELLRGGNGCRIKGKNERRN